MTQKPPEITPSMTLLEIMSCCRETEAVFRRYDKDAGVCLCCEALFDSLAGVAEKYHLDMARLLGDLRAQVRRGPS